MARCPLRRCQGRRGCLCPKKPGAVGTYGQFVEATADAEGSGRAAAPKPRRQTTPKSKRNRAGRPPPASTPAAKAKPRPAPPVVTPAHAEHDAAATDQVPPEAAAAPPVAAPPVAPQSGIATLRYNHYRHEVQITVPPGAIAKEDINELFSLSYGFKGDYRIHLVSDGNDHDHTRLDETATDIVGLELDREYWLSVEEDAEAESRVVRTVYRATGGGESHRRLEGSDGFGGEDSASCSCIEGNPCAVKYNCRDWANRLEVAKRHGWKGF